MEQYRGTLKRRIQLYVSAMLLMSSSIILVNNYLAPKGVMEPMVEGFVIGMFLALEIMLIFLIIRTQKAVRNDEALKKFYIKENDERRKYIRQSIGAPTTLVIYFLLVFATLISGFFNTTVFNTLVAVDLGVGGIIAIMKVYYLRKY